MATISRNNNIINFNSDQNYLYTFSVPTGFLLRRKLDKAEAMYNPVAPEIIEIRVTNKKSEVMSYEDIKYSIKKIGKYAHTIRLYCESYAPDYVANVIRKFEDTYYIELVVTSELTNESLRKISAYCKNIVLDLTDTFTVDDVKEKIKTVCDSFPSAGIIITLNEANYISILSLAEELVNIGWKINSLKITFTWPTDKTKEFSKLKQVRRVFNKYSNLGYNISFDGCSSPNFINSIMNVANRDSLVRYAQPCEASRFSVFVETDGIIYPCRKVTNMGGVKVSKVNESLLWKHKTISDFRAKLICNYRTCPVYDMCKLKWEK